MTVPIKVIAALDCVVKELNRREIDANELVSIGDFLLYLGNHVHANITLEQLFKNAYAQLEAFYGCPMEKV